jgi:hypothetical protein
VPSIGLSWKIESDTIFEDSYFLSGEFTQACWHDMSVFVCVMITVRISCYHAVLSYLFTSNIFALFLFLFYFLPSVKSIIFCLFLFPPQHCLKINHSVVNTEIQSVLFFFFFGGTGIWTQSFVIVKQILITWATPLVLNHEILIATSDWKSEVSTFQTIQEP